jgi:hypothetical protein
MGWKVTVAMAAPALAVMLAACGGSTTTGSQASSTAASTPSTTSAEATTTIGSTTVVTTAMSTTAPSLARATMPDVVCLNLQDAQDKIQETGIFFSRSHDATGKARFQVLDRNWIVVAQTPAVGTPIGEGDAVLDVVKYGESNPCGA